MTNITKKEKVALVLEGGAKRGMYTAGVLDTLMKNNINIDGIIGVSAGALFGINYFSNQPGRVIRYTKKYSKDIRYISKLSLFLTGNIVNKNFAFYQVTKKLDPIDNQTFIKNNKDFYATVTNIETGKPEYIKITNPLEQLEYLRATSALPLASKIIKINGKKYLDGALADSIPIEKSKTLGYDKIIVVLTRPIDYRKSKVNDKELKLIKLKYHKYPNLIKNIETRHQNYNNTVENLIDLENKKEIFVIRPSKPIIIDLIERDNDKIEEIYNLGIDDATKKIDNLKKYLNQK